MAYTAAVNNVIREGNLGIQAFGSADVRNNRISHNSGIGLKVASTVETSHNRIYSNHIVFKPT